MTTFIIIWLLCAIPAAVIAHSKNLNVVAWFFLGAVFGVFGIVAVLRQARKPSVWRAGGTPTVAAAVAAAAEAVAEAVAAEDDDAGKRPSTTTVMPSVLTENRCMRRGVRPDHPRVHEKPVATAVDTGLPPPSAAFPNRFGVGAWMFGPTTQSVAPLPPSRVEAAVAPLWSSLPARALESFAPLG